MKMGRRPHSLIDLDMLLRPALTGHFDAALHQSLTCELAAVISHPANSGDELRQVDGLHKVLAETGFVATTPVLIHAVAAHRDARHTADCANAAHELVAIAVGQTKIADNDIERLPIDRRACAGGISSRGHRKSSRAQEPANSPRGVVVIFDEQKPHFGLLSVFCRREVRCFADQIGLGSGQLDDECGPLTQTGALRANRATMQFDEGLGNRQPEPKASELPGNFRSSLLEGIEDSRQRFHRDADAAVLHSHFPPSACPPCSRYPDRAVLWGEFDRIDQHITKHLLEPGRIGGDQRGCIAKFGFQTNSFFTHLRAATPADVAHAFIEIDWFDVQFDLTAGDAAKIEQVVDELRFKLDVALYHREVFPHCRPQVGIELQRSHAQ